MSERPFPARWLTWLRFSVLVFAASALALGAFGDAGEILLRGTLVNADGSPAVGTTVLVLGARQGADGEVAALLVIGSDGRVRNQADSDAEGRFTVELQRDRIMPGRVLVCILTAEGIRPLGTHQVRAYPDGEWPAAGVDLGEIRIGPSQKPRTLTVATLYEGDVPYVLHPSGCYVRTGAGAEKWMAADLRFSEEFLGPFTETREVSALRRAIARATGDDPTPEEVWEAARGIINWLNAHDTGDAEASRELMRDGWPVVEAIAAHYARHGELPVGTCFSRAHTVFQLFRVCNLPNEDFGIATACYEAQAGGGATHVYLGLRVNGRWYYIDPTRTVPPYETRESVGRRMGLAGGCDYVHPRQFKTSAAASFRGIPLLGVLSETPAGTSVSE